MIDITELQTNTNAYSYSYSSSSSSQQPPHSHKFLQHGLRLLQLLCEGHNLALQNYLRVQSNNYQSYDLISETAALLEAIEKDIDSTNLDQAVQLFATITEYCQGPCPDNQNALIRTKLCDSVNNILQNKLKLTDEESVIQLQVRQKSKF